MIRETIPQHLHLQRLEQRCKICKSKMNKLDIISTYRCSNCKNHLQAYSYGNFLEEEITLLNYVINFNHKNNITKIFRYEPNNNLNQILEVNNLDLLKEEPEEILKKIKLLITFS